MYLKHAHTYQALQNDLWMWDQDWKCSQLKMKKLTKKLTPLYSDDPTASDLDSTTGDLGSSAENMDPSKELTVLEKKFEQVMETSTFLYKNQAKVPGYPGALFCLTSSLVQISNRLGPMAELRMPNSKKHISAKFFYDTYLICFLSQIKCACC